MVDMNRKKLGYITIPILISWGLYLLMRSYYVKTEGPWFKPAPYTFFFTWAFLFGYIGLIMYKASEDDKTKLYNWCIAILAVSYAWMLCVAWRKVAILLYIPLLAISIYIDKILYKEYEWSFSPFIAWCIFALTLSSHTRYYSIKDRYSRKKPKIEIRFD